MAWTTLCGAVMSVLAATGMPEIVAHRGASETAPENTRAAYVEAWAQGADAIEGDFYLTRDGEVVCIHDKTTKRTADRDLPVAESSLAELRALDLGARKLPTYAGERILTLAEMLALVPSGKKALLEIKCGPEIVPAFKAILAASKVPAGQLRIISFNADVIAAVKQQLPEIKAYWLTGFKQDKATGQWSPKHAEVMATLARTKADGLDAQAKLEMLTPEFVKQLREAGYEFHAWTVDDTAVAKKLIDLGVDSITTNRPKLLRESLEAK